MDMSYFVFETTSYICAFLSQKTESQSGLLISVGKYLLPFIICFQYFGGTYCEVAFSQSRRYN